MADGRGCTCYADYIGECVCGADWTPQEVIDLKERVNKLEGALKAIKRKGSSMTFDVVACATKALSESKGDKS